MSAKTDEVPTAFSRQDLVLINNALNEILNGPHAIGESLKLALVLIGLTPRSC